MVNMQRKADVSRSLGGMVKVQANDSGYVEKLFVKEGKLKVLPRFMKLNGTF